MNTVVIIPTIDPDEKLFSIVNDLRARSFTRFIVVDDGSEASRDPLFAELERQGATVLHHAANLGKGAALKTGLSAVRSTFPDATHIVTMDDDGQHLPEDVERVALAAAGSHDHVVIGVRDLHDKSTPVRSRLGSAFSSAYFKFDTGVSCPDTQTGLRAMPISLIPFALSIPGNRYEYEMNFLTAVAKQDIPLLMMPITTVYQDRNASSHFDTVRDSLRIYRQLFRFAGSSLACSVVDLGLFALITGLFNLQTGLLVALATTVARLCSGLLNFGLNRAWSFSDTGSRNDAAGKQAIRYATLFVAQMLASMGLVTVFSIFPAPLVVVKMLVDTALFVVSYFAQRNWVFKAPARKQLVVLKGGASDARSVSSQSTRIA